MRRQTEEKPMLADWSLERELYQKGYTAVCGLDEAGAGPLAGPVFAAAVILPPGLCIPGLKDSKRLSEKKREQLYEVITQQALAWSLASVSAAEIDRINILNARMLAMEQARQALTMSADFALIDGNCNRGIAQPNRTVVGGDGISVSMAAAAVLAKVSRDRYMIGMLHEAYPQYAFDRHKGYGTKLHYQRLDTYGPCAQHRRSFLNRWEAGR